MLATSLLACAGEQAIEQPPVAARVEAPSSGEAEDGRQVPEPAFQPLEPQLREPIYDQLVARVTGGAEPSAESEATAWVHYKAKDYEQAQAAFALASLHDRAAWKHPFNLACVSARLHDEGLVRVGLSEAMRRDPEATAAKAVGDGDLAAYRNAPWWEMTVGPRPAPGEYEAELEIPTAAELAGPKLGEPSILPIGRHTPVAAERMDAVRAKLMDLRGLYPQIRATLEFSDAAGQVHAYAVYDAAVLDECMLTRHKQVCLREWGEDREAGGGWDQSHCVHAYLARLSFPREAGGELEAEERYLSLGCGPAKVYRLDLVDADGDGAEEVVIDIRSHGVVLGRRYTKDYLRSRVFEVHRLDGTKQFAFDHDLRTFTITDTYELFRRIVAKDVNGDGYVDLVIQAREVQANSMYRVDAELWPVLSDPSYPPGRHVGELKTEVRHYKPGEDRW